MPQVLRPEGVMVYSEVLAGLVDSQTEIPSGSEVRFDTDRNFPVCLGL